MLFENMHQTVTAILRQIGGSAKDHYRLSQVWFRSLLAKQTAALIGVVLVLWHFNEPYNAQPMVFVGIVIGALSLALPVRLSLKAALLVAVLSAVWAVGFGNDYNAKLQLALAVSSERALLLVGCYITAALFLARIPMTTFGLLCLLNSVLTIGSWILNGTPIGLSWTDSYNSAFTATLLPFVPPILLPLPLLAVFISQGALGYAILGVHFLVFVARGYHRYIPYLCVVLAFLAYNWRMIPCSGRSVMYWHALDFWWHSGHRWLGLGLGSWQTLGPVVQKLNNFQPGEYWVSLHNDWLQHLFDCGVLGLATAVWAYVDALWVNRRDITMFSTLCGLGCFAVFYYPFQVPIFALPLTLIVFIALRVRHDSTSNTEEKDPLADDEESASKTQSPVSQGEEVDPADRGFTT